MSYLSGVLFINIAICVQENPRSTSLSVSFNPSACGHGYKSPYRATIASTKQETHLAEEKPFSRLLKLPSRRYFHLYVKTFVSIVVLYSGEL